MRSVAALALSALFLLTLPEAGGAEGAPALDWIGISANGRHFVAAKTGARFTPWGFNYDRDEAGRLIEDYWDAEWATVAQDFREMKDLGANVVRVHLQLGKFMRAPTEPEPHALAQLGRLLRLAEETGLHVDITGLGCYHKKDVPPWYAAMAEADRWEVQAAFWSAIARVAAESPAVFCYDLMNEPILPGANKRETEWLAGELGGKFFVQRITLDLAGRTQAEVARQWLDRLVAAIRAHDSRHLITLGTIPWNMVFPGAKPLFFAKDVGAGLDFVSVHFYPKKDEVPKALTALAAYDLGKPVLIEEMFPLRCSVEELGMFIEGSRRVADGWIGFYWGKTIADYAQAPTSASAALTRSWLEFFREKSAAMKNRRD